MENLLPLKPTDFNIAAYCRVSTEEQVRGYSIEGQQKAIRERVKASGHDPAKIVWYIDLGISARARKRPKMEALLADIEGGLVNAVYAWKTDRLFRTALEYSRFVYEYCQEHNVYLTLINENLNLRGRADPSTKLVVALQGAVAEMEWDNIRERSRLGRESAILQGYYPLARAPWGFKKLRKGSKLTLADVAIDEKTAPLVREVFERATYESTIRITKDLNRRKIPPPRNGKQWTDSYVSRKIIHNAKHKGVWTAAYRDEKGTLQTRVFEDGPAIVTTDLWLEANNAVAERRESKESGGTAINKSFVFTNEPPHLKGLLICSCCGKKVTPHLNSNSRKNPLERTTYYARSKRIRLTSGEGCTLVTYHRAEAIHVQARAALIEVFCDNEAFSSAITSIHDIPAHHAKYLTELDEKAKRAADMYFNGHIDKAAYDEYMAQLAQERAALTVGVSSTRLVTYASKVKDIGEAFKDGVLALEELVPLLHTMRARFVLDNEGLNRVRFELAR